MTSLTALAKGLLPAFGLVLAAGASTASAEALSPGDIVLVTQGESGVHFVHPPGGPITTVSQYGMLNAPSHVLLDPQGRILTVSRLNDRVVRVDPATGTQETLASGPALDFPTALAFDADYNLYVGADGNVVHVNLATGAITPVSDGKVVGGVQDLDVDAQGRIVLLDGSLAFPNELRRLDPVTRQWEILNRGGILSRPVDLLILPGGDYLISDSFPAGTGQIVRMNPETGEQQRVGTGLITPGWIAPLDERTVVFAPFNTEHPLLHIDIETGAQTELGIYRFPAGVNVVGVAPVPVPEPASAFVGAVCAAGLLLRRPRRQLLS